MKESPAGQAIQEEIQRSAKKIKKQRSEIMRAYTTRSDAVDTQQLDDGVLEQAELLLEMMVGILIQSLPFFLIKL